MKTVNAKGELPYKIPHHINWDVDDYTSYLMRLKAETDPTFRRCFTPRYDITRMFHHRLAKKIFGNVKSHFVIFIRGLVGVDTGTGAMKSSSAIELMMLYDTHPDVNKIGFSNDDILNKVQEIVKIQTQTPHTLFIRDETPESLRIRSNIEFNTLREAIRQKQISFILVKPELENLNSATFVLEPMYHSTDLSWVKHAVYVEGSGYIGFVVLKIHLNNSLWLAYSPYKDAYLDKVVARQTGQFQHKELAERFMKTPQYKNCISPTGKLIPLRVKKYLREVFPNVTNDESSYIRDSIKEIYQQQQEKEEEEENP